MPSVYERSLKIIHIKVISYTNSKISTEIDSLLKESVYRRTRYSLGLLHDYTDIDNVAFLSDNCIVNSFSNR